MYLGQSLCIKFIFMHSIYDVFLPLEIFWKNAFSLTYTATKQTSINVKYVIYRDRSMWVSTCSIVIVEERRLKLLVKVLQTLDKTDCDSLEILELFMRSCAAHTRPDPARPQTHVPSALFLFIPAENRK